MLFRLYTLGCKVNQYETEIIRTSLLQAGYCEAGADSDPDLIVVNTCVVTAESEAKSRKMLRKFANEYPKAKVIAMGCAVTQKPGDVLRIKGVSAAFSLQQVRSDSLRTEGQCPDVLRQLGIEQLSTGIDSFGSRHRAFVKIQDGCRAGCSYCIIPKLRPTLSSRPMEDILSEIQRLARNGYREIVLTGIHLGQYGREAAGEQSFVQPFDCAADDSHLTELLRRLVDLPEDFRLRLSSLEAAEISGSLVDLMVSYPDRICPHLHVPMQSGSDSVLVRMKRRWMSGPFVRRCEELLSRFDRLALTTDIIVGFPGETEEQFEETCRVVEHIRFSKIHVFRYSPRHGTEAAALPDHIPALEQKRRANVLTGLADQLRSEFAATLVGMEERVLLETPTRGTIGRYMDVHLSEASQPGRLVSVHIERSEGEICAGRLGIQSADSFPGDKTNRR